MTHPQADFEPMSLNMILLPQFLWHWENPHIPSPALVFSFEASLYPVSACLACSSSHVVTAAPISFLWGHLLSTDRLLHHVSSLAMTWCLWPHSPMRITVLKNEVLAGAKLSVNILWSGEQGGNIKMVKVVVPGNDFSLALAWHLVQTGRKWQLCSV